MEKTKLKIYLYLYIFILSFQLISCKKYIVRNVCVSMFSNIYEKYGNINEIEDNKYFSNKINKTIHISRTAQAKFNEIVESIEINGKEVENKIENETYIKIQHNKYYCYDSNQNKLNNEYWINKRHLQLLSEYKLNKYYENKVKYSKYDIELQEKYYNGELYKYEDLFNIKNKGVLIKTVYLERKNEDLYYKFFLPGTEFEFFESKRDNDKLIAFYNDFRDKTKTFEIDKGAVILYKDYLKYKDNILLMRKLFLKLLYSWIKEADLHGKIMPYVWGGTSIGIPLDKSFIYNINLDSGDKFYSWKTKKEGSPIGCDCSGLICLASQIIGFPFYLRNSMSQKKYLSKLKKEENILNGDILWIPGHVFILDIDNNSFIESSSYTAGYKGLDVKLLHERFENIFTIEDLKNKYFKNESIFLIDINGNKKEINDYEILSLDSCYKVNYNY